MLRPMAHRFVHLSFSASSLADVEVRAGHLGKARVSNGAVTNDIDFESGAVTAGVIARGRKADATFYRKPPVLEGLTAEVIEGAEGPETVFTDASGESHTVRGALFGGRRSASLLLVTLEMPGDRHDLLAIDTSSRAWPSIRLPATFRTVIAVQGGLGAALSERDGMEGLLHVVCPGPRAISLTMPRSYASIDVALAGADVVALAASTLLTIDTAALTFDRSHRALALTYEPVVERGRSIEEPGVVVYAFATTFGVQHPALGRLTVSRGPSDPPVAVGQRVRLDDVREPLPGVVKVHAYRPVETDELGASTSTAPRVGTLSLDAPDVAPRGETIEIGSQHRVADLLHWASRWSFVPSQTLVQFFRCIDEDPVLARWLDQLGWAAIDVRELSTDWAADPSLLLFAAEGHGDGYGLYLYPPALARGEAPPIVRFFHETNEVAFLARNLEDFLALFLEGSDIGRLAKERLRAAGIDLLQARPPSEDDAPSYLPPMGIEGIPSLAELRALEESGALLEAERGYLRWHIQRDALRFEKKDVPFTVGYESLLRIYDKLGWETAKEILQRSVG